MPRVCFHRRIALFLRPPSVLLMALPPALLSLTASCGPGKDAAGEVIRDYVQAVQDRDVPALRCLLVGADAEDADPAAFEAWLDDRYARYETGRDQGGVELDEEGVLLVKAFALGKGTYYYVERSERQGDALIADSRVRFGYTQVNYSDLSPGTTFYLAGWPPGRIRALRVPARAGTLRAEVLDRIVVRWTLVREPESASCPERWSVAAVEPLADSAERINWAVEWQ